MSSAPRPKGETLLLRHRAFVADKGRRGEDEAAAERLLALLERIERLRCQPLYKLENSN